MSRRSWYSVKWTVALLLISVSLCAQDGPVVRQLTLSQMTSGAGLIVRGQVVSAVVENHPALTHLPTVLVTLRVAETLKGSPAETLTFREFLWTTSRIRAVPPQYRPGTQVMLLLRPASQYGMTSPIGLEQGTFRILKDKDGKDVAVNGHNNRGLFSGTSDALGSKYAALSATAAATVRSTKPGAIRVSDLSEIIRRLSEVQ